ncbi:MAG: NAD(P)-binding protein [Verrucomicrobiales bacterium]|nr:NAD(P)-binding protein [Verrucomicrobiales bacterium]
MKKKKIAVLGGGAGSLSAVYYLTGDPNWKDKYEITVYQMGWRLGGKCASGRNSKDPGLRIEEHGVHLLFGAYENTFRLVHDCYSELGRPSGKPLSLVFEPLHSGGGDSKTGKPYPKYAFTARNTFSLYDEHSTNEHWWNREISAEQRLPGTTSQKNEPDFLSVLSKFTKTIFNDLLALRISFAEALQEIWDTELDMNFPDVILQSLHKDPDIPIDFQRLILLLLPEYDSYIKETENEKPAGFLESALSHSNVSVEQFRNSSLLEAVDTAINNSVSKSLESSQYIELMEELYSEHLKRLQSLDAFRAELEKIKLDDRKKQKKLDEFIAGLNRLAYTNQLCGAIAIGLFRHRVFETGLDPLDSIEFTDWLKQNGIDETHKRIWMSPIVQGIYETVFGYRFEAGPRGTTIKQPNLSTAVALRGAIRFFADCDGGFVWEMNSGMGDTIFAPLYLVLKRRGVEFRFFHKVDQLVLEKKKDKTFVKEIRISKQIRSLKDNRDLSEYDPLIHIDLKKKEEVDAANDHSLECWPNQPKYELFSDNCAERLKEIYCNSNGTIDLESDSFDWGLYPKDEPYTNEQFTLRYDSDQDNSFDKLIIGAGLGAIPKLLKPTDGSNTIWPDTPESDGYTWKELTEELFTLKTQSVQLWMNCKPLKDQEDDPRITAFRDDWPNWVGMTQVRETECWNNSEKVEHIAYLYRQLEEVFDENPSPCPDPARAKDTLQKQLIKF